MIAGVPLQADSGLLCCLLHFHGKEKILFYLSPQPPTSSSTCRSTYKCETGSSRRPGLSAAPRDSVRKLSQSSQCLICRPFQQSSSKRVYTYVFGNQILTGDLFHSIGVKSSQIQSRTFFNHYCIEHRTSSIAQYCLAF